MSRLLRGFAAALATTVLVAWVNSDLVGQALTSVDWTTYGGDLSSRRYRPFDQINRDNFKNLEVAWRFKTDALGAAEKVFVDLACSSHNAMWEKNHLLLFQASLEWLSKGTVNGMERGVVRMGD